MPMVSETSERMSLVTNNNNRNDDERMTVVASDSIKFGLKEIQNRQTAALNNSGFLFGGAITLPIYGFLLDLGSPQIVFWASAFFSVCSVLTITLHSRSKKSEL